MALTMTRYRTQTTLTKLAQRTAELNAELAYLDELEGAADLQPVLERRRAALLRDLAALHATLRQFDPEIDPAEIGTAEAWWRRSIPNCSARQLKRRYLEWLRANTAA